MKIIIIGDGKVGYSLAENLSKEDHNVTIIDKNTEALKRADEHLDVMCIKGNGVSTKVLLDAGVRSADLLIAATTSDEINMVCCLTGKKLGAARTIARIRDPEYANELTMLKAELGLDMVINPEQAAADEIARLLRFPSAINNIESFAKGRVELVEVKVASTSPIVGMTIKQISGKIPSSVLIGVVVRGDEVIIPYGDLKINENDFIYIIGKPSNVYNTCKILGTCTQKIRYVMIIGGGRISYYLTNLLYDMGIKVKIIENDRDRCNQLSEMLPHTLIIHGDGTDEELLQSENVHDMDAFITMTGSDEQNLMSALLARQNGVQKVIPKVSRVNYANIVKSLGIDSVVSPKVITTNHILKYVRGLKNVRGNTIESLYRIIDGKAEVIEFVVNETTNFLNVPIKNLKLNKDALVAAIVRNGDIIIPHGNDIIKKGDRIIIIARNKSISDINEIIDTGGLHSELQNSIKKFGDSINM